jgi:hypothetical protein
LLPLFCEPLVVLPLFGVIGCTVWIPFRKREE